MNDRTNRLAQLLRLMDADDQAPPPPDELDGLLRDWHREHADAAAASRARILSAIGADERRPAPVARRTLRGTLAFIGPALRRGAASRSLRAAACIVLAAVLATIALMPARQPAGAATMVVAEGGELTAFAEDGDRLGPCPLQHTDVAAEVSGPVTRVTVRQLYANPYQRKIEASYTFPLADRASVDSMRILVRGADGVERIVEGEVKERRAARRAYEEARRAGMVASLLEQERRNVFTQSVANIEPGATVTVEIGYVEFLERVEGEYRFAFPMTVAPRYVPGTPTAGPGDLPAGLVRRAGVVLLAPCEATVTTPGASLTGQALQAMLVGATPIRTPTPEWMERPAANLGQPVSFTVAYDNGSREPGQFFEAGAVGQVNGRWFHAPTRFTGTGFAADTPRVPDASRVTPMPNRPEERAGHDVSMSVTIDTGGGAVSDVRSELHEIVEAPAASPRRRTFSLASKSTIPNRDFVLSWRATPPAGEVATSAVLTHLRTAADETAGGYLAVVLEPPNRPKPGEVMPREMTFLVDVSGSMQGFPIEKSKEVVAKAIAAMRPADTFNVVTFAGGTRTLWPEPRIATEENRREARTFIDAQEGNGGTEMLAALESALAAPRDGQWMSPRSLADLPADGRTVRVEAAPEAIDRDGGTVRFDDGRSMRMVLGVQIPAARPGDGAAQALQLTGRWTTEGGDRVLVVDTARFARRTIDPNRIVVLLTDGLIGNDAEIIDLVHRNAPNARVHAFGIGNSVNRALLDGAARAGRGSAEFVTLQGDADAAVARLVRRLDAPVLVDIDVSFSGLDVTELVPAPERIPDLCDESPLVLVGRFTAPAGVAGTPARPSVTVRGRNAAGPWERTIPIDVAAATEDNRAVASLWARARVETVAESHEQAIATDTLAAPLRREIVRLGERYRIMTPFTSFVAVEKSRVTVGGEPMLVDIPIELPEGMSWKGLFGEGIAPSSWASRIAPDDPDLTRRRGEAVRRLSERAAPNASPDAAPASLFFDPAPLDLREREEAIRRLDQSVNAAKTLLEQGKAAEADFTVLSSLGRLDELRRRGVVPADAAARLGAEFDKLAAETAPAAAAAAGANQDEDLLVTGDAQAPSAEKRVDDAVFSQLKRVRQLQLELNYDAAIDVLDEILFVAPKQPAALALKDIIATSREYRRLSRDGRVSRWEAYSAESTKELQKLQIETTRPAPPQFGVPADDESAGTDINGGNSGAFAPDMVDIAKSIRRGNGDFFEASPASSYSKDLGKVVQFSGAAGYLSTTATNSAVDTLHEAESADWPEGWPKGLVIQRSGAPDLAAAGIDLQAAMRRPLDLNLADTSLAEAIDSIAQITGVPFSVDWRNLASMSVAPETPVALMLKNVPADQALNAILERVGRPGDATRPSVELRDGVAAVVVERKPEEKSDAPVPALSETAPPPPMPAPTSEDLRRDTGAVAGKRQHVTEPIAAPGRTPGQTSGQTSPSGAPPTDPAPLDNRKDAKDAPAPSAPAPKPDALKPDAPMPGGAGGLGGGGGGAASATKLKEEAATGDRSTVKREEWAAKSLPKTAAESGRPAGEKPAGTATTSGSGSTYKSAAPDRPSDKASDKPSSGAPNGAPSGAPDRSAGAPPVAAPGAAPESVPASVSGPVPGAAKSLGGPPQPTALAVVPRPNLTAEQRDLLARRVARDLLIVALAAELSSDAAREIAETSSPKIAIASDGRVRVTILMDASGTGIEADELAVLKRNGAVIDEIDRLHRIVVARIAPEDVIAVALFGSIRRMEPFHGSPDRHTSSAPVR